jgi:uncharacterized protein
MEPLEVMQNFTPIPSLLGGLLIGAAATLLLMLNGRIAGISGILGGLASPRQGDVGWRISFIAGLLVGGLLLLALHPAALRVEYAPSLGMAIAAGVLVGFGTQLGGGCTSGHGVCGVSRLSPRSIVATATFISSGALAVVILKQLGLGAGQ